MMAEEKTKEEKAKLRRPIGIYLRVATRAEIERIAAKNNLTVHAVCAYAITDFVRRHKAGRAVIKMKKMTVMDLDV